MQRVDGVGKLVDLGSVETYHPNDTYAVCHWKVDKRNYFGASNFESRVLGPMHKIFPNPDGWVLDGEAVRIDVLSIRLRTRALAIRKIRPPTAQAGV